MVRGVMVWFALYANRVDLHAESTSSLMMIGAVMEASLF